MSSYLTSNPLFGGLNLGTLSNPWLTPADAQNNWIPAINNELVTLTDNIHAGTIRGGLNLNALGVNGIDDVNRILIQPQSSMMPKWTLMNLETSWISTGFNGEYKSPATYPGSFASMMVDGQRIAGQQDYGGSGQDPLGDNAFGFPRAASIGGVGLGVGEFHFDKTTGTFYYKPDGTIGAQVIECAAAAGSRDVIDCTDRQWWEFLGIDFYGSVYGATLRRDNCVGVRDRDCWHHAGHKILFTDKGSDIETVGARVFDGDHRGIGTSNHSPFTGTIRQLYRDVDVYDIGRLPTDDGDIEACMLGPMDEATLDDVRIFDIGTANIPFVGLEVSVGFMHGMGLSIDGANADMSRVHVTNTFGTGALLSAKNKEFVTQHFYGSVLKDCNMSNRSGQSPLRIRALPEGTDWGNPGYGGHLHAFVRNIDIIGGYAPLTGNGAIYMQAKGADEYTNDNDSVSQANVHLQNVAVHNCDAHREMYVFENLGKSLVAKGKVNLIEQHHMDWHPLPAAQGGTSLGVRFNLLQAMGNGTPIVSGSFWETDQLVGNVAGFYTFDAGYETQGAPNSVFGDPGFIAGASADKITDEIYPTSDSLVYLKGSTSYIDENGQPANYSDTDFHGHPFEDPPSIGAVEFKKGDVKGLTSGVYLDPFDLPITIVVGAQVPSVVSLKILTTGLDEVVVQFGEDVVVDDDFLNGLELYDNIAGEVVPTVSVTYVNSTATYKANRGFTDTDDITVRYTR